jgi:hypothetical protein
VLEPVRAKAYMFSSPSIARDVLLIGALNGPLPARELAGGKELRTFRTEASKACTRACLLHGGRGARR